MAGPIAALAGFSPTVEFVFVASCDLPNFTHEVVDALAKAIADHQAAIPNLKGRAQPLCALYRVDAFESLREHHQKGEARIMRWIDGLDTVMVNADEASWGRQVTNVNTPEELEAALKDQPPI
jgi:molybdenum cofactor guanylyltransferase